MGAVTFLIAPAVLGAFVQTEAPTTSVTATPGLESRREVSADPPPEIPEAGYQEVVLGGRFDQYPSTKDIDAAVAMADRYAQTWDGRAKLRCNEVLDEEQWPRLVGHKHAKIEFDMLAAEKEGFASATMVASFPTHEAADKAIVEAIRPER